MTRVVYRNSFRVLVGNASARFGVLFLVLIDSVLGKGRLSLSDVPCS